MRRKQRKRTTNNSNTLIYISGGILLVAVIAFIVAFVAYSNKLNLDSSEIIDTELFASTKENKIIENTTSASSSMGKTIEESKKELNNTTNIESKEEIKEEDKTTTSKTKVNSSTNKKENNKKEEKEPKFVSPIESSDILREFAKDNLVYSETLKEWITHLGVDIKAEKATVVKASAEGTVKSIKNDPRYGLTIIVEHSAGYQTLYANLLTTEFVSEGEKVKAGQTIGTVGDTAVYEIVDEPHLHFEIIKNNQNVNPSDLVKFKK